MTDGSRPSCVNQCYGGLDSLCQLGPSDSKTEIDRDRTRECGEASTQVANEHMPTSDDVGGDRLLEASHRRQPLFQMAMSALDAIMSNAHHQAGRRAGQAESTWLCPWSPVLASRQSLRWHVGRSLLRLQHCGVQKSKRPRRGHLDRWRDRWNSSALADGHTSHQPATWRRQSVGELARLPRRAGGSVAPTGKPCCGQP